MNQITPIQQFDPPLSLRDTAQPVSAAPSVLDTVEDGFRPHRITRTTVVLPFSATDVSVPGFGEAEDIIFDQGLLVRSAGLTENGYAFTFKTALELTKFLLFYCGGATFCGRDADPLTL